MLASSRMLLLRSSIVCNRPTKGKLFSWLLSVNFRLRYGPNVVTLSRQNEYRRSTARRLLRWVMVTGAEQLAEAVLAATANPKRPVMANVALFKYDPDEPCGVNNGSLIALAARKGFLGVMSTLMDHGAEVNVMDAWGFSPLWYMAANDNLAMARTLL